MKTFDELFAELAERDAVPARRTPAPWRLLDAGVHAIGKKVVEEAAEVWMAAEHEGAERTAEEIAQLLYHVQVLMVALRPDARRRLRTAVTARPRSTCCASPSPTRDRCPSRPAQMLREAGYRQRTDPRELVLQDPDNDTEFFFLRPRDIAIYVGSGQLDVGITGRDLLLDSGAAADEILPLGFGELDVPLRRPAGHGAHRRRPRRAAGRDRLPRAGREAPGGGRGHGRGDPARRRGRDRGAPRRRRRHRRRRRDRDARCARPGWRSSASRSCSPRRCSSAATRRSSRRPAVDQLVRRLQGVIVARTLRDDGLRRPGRPASRQACALTPGIESPTVSPLHDEGWVAVRAMVPRARHQPGHGRPVRPRRPRHPRHRHPRLPAVADGGPGGGTARAADQASCLAGLGAGPSSSPAERRWRRGGPGSRAAAAPVRRHRAGRHDPGRPRGPGPARARALRGTGRTVGLWTAVPAGHGAGAGLPGLPGPARCVRDDRRLSAASAWAGS